MKINRAFIAGCAFATALLPALVRADEMVTEERVVPENRLAADVAVRDVRTSGDTISGTVVNRSPNPVRDVRLVVSHVWLWDNEMHPGVDDFSRADYYTVPGEIPPGGQVPFTIRPSTPLSEARGGHYMTQVGITSVVSIERGGSPTAGARAAEPAPLREDEGTRGVVPAPRRPEDQGTRAPAPRRLEDEGVGD